MYMLQMEMVSHLKNIKCVACGGSRENAEVMNIATQSGHGGRYREISNIRICSSKCFQIEGFILLSVSNPMFVFLHYEYHQPLCKRMPLTWFLPVAQGLAAQHFHRNFLKSSRKRMSNVRGVVMMCTVKEHGSDKNSEWKQNILIF